MAAATTTVDFSPCLAGRLVRPPVQSTTTTAQQSNQINQSSHNKHPSEVGVTDNKQTNKAHSTYK